MGILSGIFKARDKPQNSTVGSRYAFTMGGSSSGKFVTERSAMQMTAVYSCVRILAEAIGSSRPYDIPCPALLLCGECDKAGSTRNYNRRWSAGESLPLQWIPSAGHNSNVDQPDIVNTAIENFLNTERR